jgi:hypothetical protein
VRDIRWLRDGTIVAAVGDGLVQLYSATSTEDSKFQLKCTVDGKNDKVHSDSVRELAPSPFALHHLMSGGTFVVFFIQSFQWLTLQCD